MKTSTAGSKAMKPRKQEQQTFATLVGRALRRSAKKAAR